MNNLKTLIDEIEFGVRKIVNENIKLREELERIYKDSAWKNQKNKIQFLEMEINNFKKTIKNLQQKEVENQERIFNIRKMVQDVIDSKKPNPVNVWNEDYSDSSNQENITKTSTTQEKIPNTHKIVQDVIDNKKPNPANVWNEDYSNSSNQENITKNPTTDAAGLKEAINSFKTNKVFTDNARFEKKTQKTNLSAPNNPTKSFTTDHKQDFTAAYSEPQDVAKINQNFSETQEKINKNHDDKKQKDNQFFFNDFVNDEDPFGTEEQKIDDENFFKESSKKPPTL
jgi:hypothetical protein